MTRGNPTKHKITVAQMREAAAKGWSQQTIATYFGISQNAVSVFCTRNNIRTKGFSEKRFQPRDAGAAWLNGPPPAPPPPTCTPPSPAMLALAAFDPVIARAARYRQRHST